MATLRERRREMLRAEILEAAHALVLERGYHAMSMEELAVRVGVSKPTLYNQFPTKEDLLVEASRHQLLRFVELAETGAGEIGDPLDQLCAVLQTMIEAQVADQVAVSSIGVPDLLQVLRNNPPTRTLLDRIDLAVVRLVQAAFAEGLIDPALDLATVVRAFYGLILAPLRGEESCVPLADPSRVSTTIAQIFRRGVAPSHP